MRYFLIGLGLLVPLTSSAKSPCQPPPNRAQASVVIGRQETRNDTVMLTQADYSRLYEWYNRCLIARSGNKQDWTNFLRRSDEAERVATDTAENAPFLQHLESIESVAENSHADAPSSPAELERLHLLEVAIAQLKVQVNELVPKSEPCAQPQALAAAE